jgi:membrane-bound inhibitor of C-type lysozyme
MLRFSILAIAMATCSGGANAQAVVSIPFNIGPADNVSSQIYACGETEPFAVQYVNAGANALALLPIDGEARIFVNVVSASGAKYVSGAYVWWTKGDSATLENEMEAGSLQECKAQ